MTNSDVHSETSNIKWLSPDYIRARKGKLQFILLSSVVFLGIGWFHNMVASPQSSHDFQQRMLKETGEAKEPSAPQQTPLIYTFDDPSFSNRLLSDYAKLQLWTEFWTEAGWKPVILTIHDAKKHPDFKIVDEMLGNKNKHNHRYYRYLAMSALPDGGWFSEPFVLPLYANREIANGFSLPNNGKFTIHNEKMPDLISGNREEWNRMTNILLHAGDENDVASIINLRKDSPSPFLSKNDVVGAERFYNMEQFDDFCGTAQQKRGISFSNEFLNRTGTNEEDYPSVVKALMTTWRKTCRSSRPVMHTFFEPAYKNYDRPLSTLQLWQKAWEDAGWVTVVHTLNDAKRHPMYENFGEAFLRAGADKMGDYNRMNFYRWLAMASSGGGWMSDYDTFPVHSQPFTDAGVLPNEGKFTGFNNHVPCLMAGSASEWNRVSGLIFNSYRDHAKEPWNDMRALLEVHWKHDDLVFTNEVLSATWLYKTQIEENGKVAKPYSLKDKCHSAQGKKAIHFSHASCEKVEFCDKNRIDGIKQWVNAWQQQCMGATMKKKKE